MAKPLQFLGFRTFDFVDNHEIAVINEVGFAQHLLNQRVRNLVGGGCIADDTNMAGLFLHRDDAAGGAACKRLVLSAYWPLPPISTAFFDRV